MSMKPMVSVCTITYNHEQYIQQALESALAQDTTFDVECVVGEDCSTDGTREVLSRLVSSSSGNVRLLPFASNMGMLSNFSRTLSACRGKYVAFLEGDDYWSDARKLQKQVDYMEIHRDAALCFHDADVIDSEGTTVGTYLTSRDHRDLPFQTMLTRSIIPTCSVVARRSAVPALPEWFQGLGMGDWPLWVLCAERGCVGYLEGRMAVYRRHDGGVWTNASDAERTKAVLRVLVALDAHFRSRYAHVLRAAAREAWDDYVRRVALRSSRIGTVKGALRCADGELSSWVLLGAERWLRVHQMQVEVLSALATGSHVSRSQAVRSLGRLAALAPWRMVRWPLRAAVAERLLGSAAAARVRDMWRSGATTRVGVPDGESPAVSRRSSGGEG
jgi:glycosyltransferase involved in cell wall biosynthesis